MMKGRKKLDAGATIPEIIAHGGIIMSQTGIPAEKIALYDKLIATHPEIERKGANMLYTSVNGHMFSFVSKEGQTALRLPADAREKFLKKYRTELAVTYGTVMKEYAVVPDALLKKTGELKPYLALSFDYVKSLKPKPTTRKKPAAVKKKATAKKTVAKKSKKTTTKKTAGKKKTAPKKKTSKKKAKKK